MRGPGALSVFVDPDGSVTFSGLPADLRDVIGALDPDAGADRERGDRPARMRGRARRKEG